jgi:hypothetical protein
MEEKNETEFSIYKPSPIAGYYRIGKNNTQYVKFSFENKPKRIHIFFMRILLDWHWEDNKN